MQSRSLKLGSLRLVREETFNAPAEYARRVPLSHPAAVWQFLAPFAQREESETFWIVALDAQHKAIGGSPIMITHGILNSSLIHPREVFRAAIIAGAASIVLAHNHPSGDPKPSADDRAVTDQLVAAGRLLDIPVHDHIICGNGCYISFAESGLM